jgi:putative aldouronate transport system permease protein
MSILLAKYGAFNHNKKLLKIKIKKSIPVYTLLLPSILLLLIFHYAPIFGILIAFEDFSPFKGVIASNWVGFKYFKMFLNDINFWRVLKNTIIINIYEIIFGFPFPIFFALLLNEIKSNKFKKTIQTISYLPHFISWVVVASIVTTILSPTAGLPAAIYKNILGKEPIYYLVKKEYFRTILVISSTWKGFGMSSVYYIASLSSIDQELYQAASIDGAGRLKQTWHITLPGLRNIIIVLFIINLGGIIKQKNL